MNEYAENATLASLVLALAASEKCADWTDKQIADLAPQTMDKQSPLK